MRTKRRRQDGGFTLIEVMVTSALILVVLAMVLPQLAGSITTFDDAHVRSDSTDQAQLAFAQIQHDVIASNVLWIQTTSGSPDVIHIETYLGNTTAGTTTTTVVPPATCVEYQVVGGVMQRRTAKAAAVPAWPATWSNVMTGIVNPSQTPLLPVFSLPGPTYRSLVVNLWVNADTRTAGKAPPSFYTTTVTGSAVPANGVSTTGACQ